MILAAAAAITMGVHPGVLAIAATAFLQPWWFLAGTALWAVVANGRSPSAGPDEEARYLEGVAAELRAGASPRAAVEGAAGRAPSIDLRRVVRLASVGSPAPEVAGALSEALSANGRLAGAAFRLATETGARAADVFADLAVRATEAGDLARERRALTAQARLSAALVGGAPIAVVALLVVSGRASALLESSGGRAIGAIGLALLVAGGLVVWVMVRTAER